LQGAALYEAGLWNIAIDDTAFGLADLRGANFTAVSVNDLLANLAAQIPEAVKQKLRERLAAKDGGLILRNQINTVNGKILVTNLNDPTWRNLDHEQLTTDPMDIDPSLAKLLADIIAPIAPPVAEKIALRVLNEENREEGRPLVKLLGCRLQAQADAKRVTLSADMIERLRKAIGRPCDKLPP